MRPLILPRRCFITIRPTDSYKRLRTFSDRAFRVVWFWAKYPSKAVHSLTSSQARFPKSRSSSVYCPQEMKTVFRCQPCLAVYQAHGRNRDGNREIGDVKSGTGTCEEIDF